MKRRDVLKGVGLTTLGLAGLSPQVKAAEVFDLTDGANLAEGPTRKKNPGNLTAAPRANWSAMPNCSKSSFLTNTR
jgi:hypothetical protein